MSAEELCCQEVVELLDDYLEDAAPPADRARIGRHLASCGDCPAYLTQLRTTIRLAGRLAGEPVPPRVTTRLLHAFRTSRHRRGHHEQA
jgi:anti-sigma factor RsiW